MHLKRVLLSNAENYFRGLSVEHPFQSFEVLKTTTGFLQRLYRHGEAYAYVILDDDDQILLLAPLRIKKNEAVLVGGEESFDYVDVIAGACPRTTLLAALQFLIFELKKSGVKRLSWRFIPETSILRALKPYDEVSHGNVKIDYSNLSYDAYFASLSKSMRQNVRTSYNRLARAGLKPSFHFYSACGIGKDLLKCRFDDQNENAVDLCSSLYNRRQNDRYGHKRLGQIVRRKYFNYVAKSARCSKSFIAMVSLNGRVAAFMQGYVNERANSLEVPRLAIDDQFGWYSPGVILINETIKYTIGNTSISMIDLCRGTEPYKVNFAGGAAFIALMTGV